MIITHQVNSLPVRIVTRVKCASGLVELVAEDEVPFFPRRGDDIVLVLGSVLIYEPKVFPQRNMIRNE